MAQAYVRLSIQVSPEVAEKLEELARLLDITRTKVVEQAINRLYEEKAGDK
jgi:predicted transcriptional regulator